MNKQIAIVVGILEYAGQILVIRRLSPGNRQWHLKWNLPGGKIEPGETTRKALVREIREETGLEVKNPNLLGVHTHFWELETHTQQTILICYHCPVQTQEVHLEPGDADAFKWVTPEEFMKLDTLDGSRPILDLYTDICYNIYQL